MVILLRAYKLDLMFEFRFIVSVIGQIISTPAVSGIEVWLRINRYLYFCKRKVRILLIRENLKQ